MAARTLAMAAASAKLCWSRGAESTISDRSFHCNDFGGVVRLRNAGLRASGVALRRDVIGFAAGKGNAGSRRPRSGMQARRKPKIQRIVEEDDVDVEKAMEALFAQLEIDLNSEEGEGGDDDAEFTDEELTQMTKDLEAAFKDMDLEGVEVEEKEEKEEKEELGFVDMVMTDGMYSQGSGVAKSIVQNEIEQELDEDDGDDHEGEDSDDDEDDEQRMVPLEKWQLRKLAIAADQGRRNVNVKSLSAELGMDRADVLSFLRDPPPELLLMSAQFDNEDNEPVVTEKVESKVEKAPKKTATSRQQQPVPPPTPSGGPQNPRNWHGNKRLKKEHVATFERVYRQTNRPSNTMIENLVNLTHVPRKKVLQWFDEKRAEHQPTKKSFEDAPES